MWQEKNLPQGQNLETKKKETKYEKNDSYKPDKVEKARANSSDKDMFVKLRFTLSRNMTMTE